MNYTSQTNFYRDIVGMLILFNTKIQIWVKKTIYINNP